MSTIFRALRWILLALVLVFGLSACYLKFSPIFGGTPDAASQAKMERSAHFNGKTFDNITPVQWPDDRKKKPSVLKWLLSMLNPPEGKHPGEPLPTVAIDGRALVEGGITWLGHSTVLVRTADKTLLFDPVFHRASPLFFGGKPFAMSQPPAIEDLPLLDAVLITHDHYDHLDYRAIRALDAQVRHFYVPLGVKGHLQRWGVADSKITELDWYESARLDSITLVFTPARHFSGRRLDNRNSTLWGSWVVQAPQMSLYFSGDGGYSPEFTTIGARFGPFDVAFVENGAYDQRWSQVHMLPEEAVRAAVDLRARVAMPIHWAKFDLAYHSWREPMERFTAAAKNTSLQVASPKIGQTFTLDALPQSHWWEGVR